MCVWYQVVRVCNPCGACVFWSTDHHEALRTKNGFGREKRPMEGRNRGLHRRPRGQNPCSFGGVAGTNLNAHTNQCTHPHTREEITILSNNGTLWANVENFSRAPARRRPSDTERLRCFAPNSAHYYHVHTLPALHHNDPFRNAGRPPLMQVFFRLKHWPFCIFYLCHRF